MKDPFIFALSGTTPAISSKSMDNRVLLGDIDTSTHNGRHSPLAEGCVLFSVPSKHFSTGLIKPQ